MTYCNTVPHTTLQRNTNNITQHLLHKSTTHYHSHQTQPVYCNTKASLTVSTACFGYQCTMLLLQLSSFLNLIVCPDIYYCWVANTFHCLSIYIYTSNTHTIQSITNFTTQHITTRPRPRTALHACLSFHAGRTCVL